MGERRSLKRCPTPTKDRYRHEAEARRAAEAAAVGYGWALEHYECRCGRWHIARVKSRETREALASARAGRSAG